MEEMLFELRDHSYGLNAGRWDYIFSAIKSFRDRPEFVLPDRTEVKMTVPFMRAYTELLVATCHRRGAFAMGGMAAVIPSRADPAANEQAIDGVRADKRREASDGFDGHLGRTSRPRRGRPRRVRRGARRRPEPDHASHRGRSNYRGRPPRRRPDTRRHHGARSARQRRRRVSVRVVLARRPRSGGDQQPHGGRRHRRNRTSPAMAVDPPPRAARRRPHHHARARRTDPRRGDGTHPRQHRRRERDCPIRPSSCSNSSCSPTTSPSS